jgi:hypothetical protein
MGEGKRPHSGQRHPNVPSADMYRFGYTLEGVRGGVNLAIVILYNISKFARRNRAASDTR